MENITLKSSFIGNAQMENKFNLHVRQIERVIAMQETGGSKAVVNVKGSGNGSSFDVYISVESSNTNLEQVLDRNLERFGGNFA